MGYVIGIDGGGSKTTYSICEVSKHTQKTFQPAATFQSKGTNPQVIGFQEMAQQIGETIKNLLNKLSIPPRDIVSVCCGLAGVGREDDEEKAALYIREKFLSIGIDRNIRLFICSDLYIALRGALNPGVKEGILVIAGTGSNAIGSTKNESVYKTGGWGHVLGDEGSGYHIALKALNKVTRSYDLRENKTLLNEMILEKLNLSSEPKLISYIYGTKPQKNEIAGLAEVVIQAADQGDHIAIQILKEASDELVQHVRSLHLMSDQFDKNTAITTAGSILTHSALIKDQFIKSITEEKLGHYQKSYATPVDGALVIAREQYEAAQSFNG
ncbi:ATPase [Jeotgalibacillus sp. S-D1]|uniref:N-acetylglucosamine kinase n=1 Tax=Jeotgalibacillus sp. S-D1 TaxID=2552189 RepID=UPI001059AC55|nr:BadF/BadG/BcrA/BcrD ATPase family protein [Jeotgalibacillus sp. S-D1]TDL33100.1 ATPase [Jeotgalibacillus sp. S-D1]